MSFKCSQLKDYIIEPSLHALGLHSPSAVNLLLGIAAQESTFGRYLVQRNIGLNGGLGIYQMEMPTFHDVWYRVVEKRSDIKENLFIYLNLNEKPLAARLCSDLALATIMTRLFFLLFPEPLPHADDIEGLAVYWKKYWNTDKGKGTVEQFIKRYYVHVKGK